MGVATVGVSELIPSLRLTWPKRTCAQKISDETHFGKRLQDQTYLGDVGVLETLLCSDGVPINVCLVAGVLDNGKEEHGFLGGRLFLLGGGVARHGGQDGGSKFQKITKVLCMKSEEMM